MKFEQYHHAFTIGWRVNGSTVKQTECTYPNNNNITIHSINKNDSLEVMLTRTTPARSENNEIVHGGACGSIH